MLRSEKAAHKLSLSQNKNTNECFQEPMNEQCLWGPESSKSDLTNDRGELNWGLTQRTLPCDKTTFSLFSYPHNLGKTQILSFSKESAENPINCTYEGDILIDGRK